MSDSSPMLREAEDADLPACADLWMAMFEEIEKHKASHFPADWPQRFVNYALRRRALDELEYFVAVIDGEVVGSAGVLLRDGYPTDIHGIASGYIFGVCVKPKARGRGLATRLTEMCVKWLRDRNVRRILLHASQYGRPIYEKMGFTPTTEMELTKKT